MKAKFVNHLFVLIVACLVFLFCCPGQQIPQQGRVEGFLLPIYDRENKLKAKIFGSQADFINESKIKISDFKAELYDEAGLQATIISAEAIFRQDQKQFETLAPVIVEHDKIRIESRALVWDLIERKAYFQQQVFVKLCLAPMFQK
jgi:hypothetical protein